MCDQTGYMLEVNISKVITGNFKKFERNIPVFEYPIKDTQNIFEEKLGQPKHYRLEQRKQIRIDRKDVRLIKGHDKEIKIC